MKLYSYWRSSCSWRVRIALNLKGLSYEYEAVHLVRGGGEQHAEAYRRLNPLRQVPTLVTGDGTAITQSLAILEYLEETHPAPPLLPEGALARARVRQLAEVVNAGIQPVQNASVLKQLEAMGQDKQAWAASFIARGLAALEAMARETAGAYLVGDAVSFADCCLVPQLYNARRWGVELTPYPTLTRVEATCQELEAFEAAHPDRQPDAPTGAA